MLKKKAKAAALLQRSADLDDSSDDGSSGPDDALPRMPAQKVMQRRVTMSLLLQEEKTHRPTVFRSDKKSRMERIRLRGEEAQMRKTLMDKIPPGEQMLFQDAFQIYARQAEKNPGLLCAALQVLDLCGETAAEQSAIVALCREAVADGDLDVVRFSVDFVPQVKFRLDELQAQKLYKTFCHFDPKQTGFVDKEGCMKFLDRLCSDSVDGIGFDEIKDDLLKTIPQVQKDLRGLDFEAFKLVAQRTKRIWKKVRAERQQKILEKYRIDADELEPHQIEQLLTLHDSFLAHDYDDSGTIERREALGIMLECGLMPRGIDEERKVLEIVAAGDMEDKLYEMVTEKHERQSMRRGTHEKPRLTSKQEVMPENPKGQAEQGPRAAGPGLPFVRFLLWVDTVRWECLESLKKELGETFRAIDVDGDGLVGRREITKMLSDNESLGLQPHSPQDQDAMQKLLDETEAGISDPVGYDFDEFLDLLQRATEYLRRSWARHEVEVGAKFGFERRTVSELRAVFYKLTTARRGVNGPYLTLSECQHVRIFVRTLSSSALKEMFNDVDVGEHGAIDFEAFILLMSMVLPRDHDARQAIVIDASLL
jgi:Ca2+-binding EF-hand superfamily protein